MTIDYSETTAEDVLFVTAKKHNDILPDETRRNELLIDARKGGSRK